jgi:hypothetical protein
MALVVSGTRLVLYLDGSVVDDVALGTPDDTTNPFRITQANNLGEDCFDGYVDEIRVSNVARYTSAFTPPTAAFVDDASTELLIHVDTNFEDDA